MGTYWRSNLTLFSWIEMPGSVEGRYFSNSNKLDFGLAYYLSLYSYDLSIRLIVRPCDFLTSLISEIFLPHNYSYPLCFYLTLIEGDISPIFEFSFVLPASSMLIKHSSSGSSTTHIGSIRMFFRLDRLPDAKRDMLEEAKETSVTAEPVLLALILKTLRTWGGDPSGFISLISGGCAYSANSSGLAFLTYVFFRMLYASCCASTLFL